MATEAVQMKVSGLMCSFCTMSVEKALKRFPGVKHVMVNLVHGIVLVESDTAQTSKGDLAAMVEKLGYNVSATEVQQFATDEAIFKLIKQRGVIGMALALLDLLVDPLNLFGLPARPRAIFSLLVSAFILLWVGYPILRKTLLAIRQRVINANVLLSASAWGSFVIGALSLFDPRWPNFLPVAGWLMALHLFFGFFKLDTRKKASEAVRKLLSLQPPRARVVRGGAPVDVLTKDVAVGEVLVVRPGERIPLDGEVIEGTASVDQSSFTGESLPASKTRGDEVIGGTVNLDGALQVRVTKVGTDSFLSQIVRLMTQIAERKPPLELLADRLMNFYGPVVFVAAGLAFAGWALATLFHELAGTNTVVFDKTGTLTYGRPTVTDVESFGTSRGEVLALARAVEASSEHPVGQAIGFFAAREGAEQLAVEGFRALPGKGVSGRVNGMEVVAGKPSFLEECGAHLGDKGRARIDALAGQGKTVVGVARDRDVVGVIALQDTPRRGAERAVEKLRRYGVRTVMLTGDARPVADAIGKQLGLDEVRSELLPADKVTTVRG